MASDEIAKLSKVLIDLCHEFDEFKNVMDRAFDAVSEFGHECIRAEAEQMLHQLKHPHYFSEDLPPI